MINCQKRNTTERLCYHANRNWIMHVIPGFYNANGNKAGEQRYGRYWSLDGQLKEDRIIPEWSLIAGAGFNAYRT